MANAETKKLSLSVKAIFLLGNFASPLVQSTPLWERYLFNQNGNLLDVRSEAMRHH